MRSNSPKTSSAKACPTCRWPTCEYVAGRRLTQLGIPAKYGSANPFPFMELQDVQELSNFFERRVSAYQLGITGTVSFDDEF